MNLKPGDKVRLLTLEEVRQKPGVEITERDNGRPMVDGWAIWPLMYEALGKVVDVVKPSVDSVLVRIPSEWVEDLIYFYPKCMVEPVSNEPAKEITPMLSFDDLF